MNMKNFKIQKPTPRVISYYQKKWYHLEKYVAQEKALNLLYHDTFTKNNNLIEILIKVSALNDFYSTTIFFPYQVSEHIYNLKIDKRLKNGDWKVVDDIANIKFKNGKRLLMFSFATKYCSHHNADAYAIYDQYVSKMLRYFRKRDKFLIFKNNDLKDSIKFHNILLSFQKHYGLEKYTFKDIDRYLWQVGKKYFQKTY